MRVLRVRIIPDPCPAELIAHLRHHLDRYRFLRHGRFSPRDFAGALKPDTLPLTTDADRKVNAVPPASLGRIAVRVKVVVG